MKQYAIFYTNCYPDGSARPMRVCERWNFRRHHFDNSAWVTPFKWWAKFIAGRQRIAKENIAVGPLDEPPGGGRGPAAAGQGETMKQLSFDECANYRGELQIKEDRGRFFWRVDCSVYGSEWSEIPQYLGAALKHYYDETRHQRIQGQGWDKLPEVPKITADRNDG